MQRLCLLRHIQLPRTNGRRVLCGAGQLGALRFLQPVLEWIGRNETSVLVALLITVTAVWVFIALADQVVEGDTMGFDEWAVRTAPRGRSFAANWTHLVGRSRT